MQRIAAGVLRAFRVKVKTGNQNVCSGIPCHKIEMRGETKSRKGFGKFFCAEKPLMIVVSVQRKLCVSWNDSFQYIAIFRTSGGFMCRFAGA